MIPRKQLCVTIPIRIKEPESSMIIHTPGIQEVKRRKVSLLEPDRANSEKTTTIERKMEQTTKTPI
ncbi:MAG: hypothetical protein ACJA1W_002152 [Akkermansiaceae bacterium]|jgi:hypothetical protein